MDTLSGKWRLNIIWVISKHDNIGFNQLKNNLPGITNMMLMRSLEALTSEGYVSKNLFGDKPPLHSEYHLTIKSHKLLPLLLKLNDLESN